MSQHSRSKPFSLADADIARLREAFDAAGFDEQGVAAALGLNDIPSLKNVSAEDAWRRTGDDTPLHVLIRLFVIGLPASPELAKRALTPAPYDRLVAGGMLRVRSNGVRAAAKMVPIDGFLVAFDRTWEGEKLEAADHVMGPSDSARRLANVTVRDRVGSALDLGSGCGYLALLASAHAGTVVASDVNPRAAAFAELNAKLNGLTTIEATSGDLFAPVAGRTFDLAFSNPPFVISPEDRLTYLNGGMKADAFCQRVAAEAPAHLAEGGTFQMLCNWVELAGAEWHERLRGWFDGAGCDVWVLRSSTTDAVTYAKNWVDVGRTSTATPDGDRLKAWLDYYAAEKIERIGGGVVTMRKRKGGDGFFRAFDGPEKLVGPCGVDVRARMNALDFLARTDDAKLMDAVLRIADSVRLTQECSPSPEGWAQSGAQVRVTEGFAYVEAIDTYFAELMVACDGKRTLRAAIDKTANALGMSASDVPVETAEIVRQLVDEGFLLPAGGSAPA